MKRLFTPEEIELLTKNIYTYKISETTIKLFSTLVNRHPVFPSVFQNAAGQQSAPASDKSHYSCFHDKSFVRRAI